jgi:hypothetical protein
MEVVKFNKTDSIAFLKGLLYLIKICKQSYLEYAVIVRGHILTAYESTPQDEDGSFLANVDIVFTNLTRQYRIHPDVQCFIDSFSKNGINIINSLLGIHINETYDFINNIFKYKLDKTADISVEILIPQPAALWTVAPMSTSNADRLRSAFLFKINMPEDHGCRIIESVHPDIVKTRLHTGISRVIRFSYDFDADNLCKTSYNDARIQPVYRYVFSEETIGRIYRDQNPTDIDLGEPDFKYDSMEKTSLVKESIVNGRISISKNMLVKEFLKSQEPVRLYIYRIAGQSNLYIFRFQGICDGIAISTDGYAVAVV